MQRNRTAERALALIEVLVVFAVVGLLAIVCMVRASARSHKPFRRIACVNNLKQISLGFRLYANDHEGRYPWQVSVKQSGTWEYAQTPEVYRHFQIASNELATPRIQHCLSDQGKTRASDWDALRNKNISYFINVASQDTNDSTIFAGDRNIVGGEPSNGSWRTVEQTSLVSWSERIHKQSGNICVGDGSVLQLGSAGLQGYVRSNLVGTARLAIP